MIGGLQGEFGDLDIKISQNISIVGRTYLKASKEHRDTMQYWLRNSPGKRCQRIRICVTGEVETLSSPIRR